ncbi:cytochrome c oxidase assembly protein Cox20p, mitochondrial [[Candida] anglica]|uniref:Cytochrome c oxidase assembly protein COX20, mitochondrial n=1 Tax=[Candida] anglica TaxID=148631 RepID=A0ABP0EK49_9ASCO
MGLFGGVPSRVSTVSEVPEQKDRYLEDLPPKFEDNETTSYQEDPTYTNVLSTIKMSDFSPNNMVMIPCFRDAMLTGFSAMGVLGVVTLLIHKNAGKAANWAVGGFFLGNIVGWEQCRSIRRKGFQNMERARQINQEKNTKKIEEAAQGDGLGTWEKLNNNSKKE